MADARGAGAGLRPGTDLDAVVVGAGFASVYVLQRAGRGSLSVLSNMVPAIEQHVNWIASCLDHLRERGLAARGYEGFRLGRGGPA